MKHWLQKDTYEREMKTSEKSLLTAEDRAAFVELQTLQEKLSSLSAIPVGEPPQILQRAAKRARDRGAVATHKLGQGGTSRLQAEFMSSPLPFSFNPLPKSNALLFPFFE